METKKLLKVTSDNEKLNKSVEMADIPATSHELRKFLINRAKSHQVYIKTDLRDLLYSQLLTFLDKLNLHIKRKVRARERIISSFLSKSLDKDMLKEKLRRIRRTTLMFENLANKNIEESASNSRMKAKVVNRDVPFLNSVTDPVIINKLPFVQVKPSGFSFPFNSKVRSTIPSHSYLRNYVPKKHDTYLSRDRIAKNIIRTGKPHSSLTYYTGHSKEILSSLGLYCVTRGYNVVLDYARLIGVYNRINEVCDGVPSEKLVDLPRDERKLFGLEDDHYISNPGIPNNLHNFSLIFRPDGSCDSPFIIGPPSSNPFKKGFCALLFLPREFWFTALAEEYVKPRMSFDDLISLGRDYIFSQDIIAMHFLPEKGFFHFTYAEYQAESPPLFVGTPLSVLENILVHQEVLSMLVSPDFLYLNNTAELEKTAL